MVLCFYEAKTRLAYLFGEHQKAVEAGEKGVQYRQAVMGTLYVSEHNFYYSQALLAQEKFTWKDSERVSENQSQLKIWAEFSPANFQHKYDLVEAEQHRILGQNLDAMELYDRAIAGVKESEYLQEEALVYELAAKFYLEWGQEKIAQVYLTDAYYAYARWGAKAKTDDLERCYPLLLAPILNRQNISLTSSTTITQSTTKKITSSYQSASALLDFSAAIEASQLLSGEIDLEKLLSKLIEVVMENAGATKSAILMPTEGNLKIVAIADAAEDTDNIQIAAIGRSLPLESTS